MISRILGEGTLKHVMWLVTSLGETHLCILISLHFPLAFSSPIAMLLSLLEITTDSNSLSPIGP
jgi:hypothetical protein